METPSTHCRWSGSRRSASMKRVRRAAERSRYPRSTRKGTRWRPTWPLAPRMGLLQDQPAGPIIGYRAPMPRGAAAIGKQGLRGVQRPEAGQWPMAGGRARSRQACLDRGQGRTDRPHGERTQRATARVAGGGSGHGPDGGQAHAPGPARCRPAPGSSAATVTTASHTPNPPARGDIGGAYRFFDRRAFAVAAMSEDDLVEGLRSGASGFPQQTPVVDRALGATLLRLGGEAAGSL